MTRRRSFTGARRHFCTDGGLGGSAHYLAVCGAKVAIGRSSLITFVPEVVSCASCRNTVEFRRAMVLMVVRDG